MSTPNLVWNPTVQQRDRVRRSFKSTLTSVLREKYIGQNWTAWQVRRYILRRYEEVISESQIIYHAKINDMLKRNRRSDPQAASSSTTRSASGAAFDQLDNRDHAASQIGVWATEHFEKSVAPLFFESGRHLQTPQSSTSVNTPRPAEASALPDVQPLVDLLTDSTEDFHNEVADHDRSLNGVCQNASAPFSTQSVVRMYEDQPSAPSRVGWALGLTPAFHYFDEDPTLLSTPGSSMSGFASMKSIKRRAGGRGGRGYTSYNQSSSARLRCMGLIESDAKDCFLCLDVREALPYFDTPSESQWENQIPTVTNEDEMDLDI